MTAPARVLAPAALARHVVVGMADCKVSRTDEETLVTYALGSCLGVVLHDPVAGVAGLLHVMLPQSSIDEEKARANPSMFVDTGVPRLFKACYELGARKERMTVSVAGGAHAGLSEEDDRFQIGKRNLLALRKLLWRNGVMIHAEETGGCGKSRTMSVAVGSGVVVLKTNGVTQLLRPDGSATAGRES